MRRNDWPADEPSRDANSVAAFMLVTVVVLLAGSVLIPLRLALNAMHQVDVPEGNIKTMPDPVELGSSSQKPSATTSCLLTVHDNLITLSNAFTKAQFSLDSAQLVLLAGDFDGQGDFGCNVLAHRGLRTEVVVGDDVAWPQPPAPLQYTVISNTSVVVSVEISGIGDASLTLTESWVLSLRKESRWLVVQMSGKILRQTNLRAVRHSAYADTSSVYALFNRGVVQMRNADEHSDHFASNDKLQTFYTLGTPPHHPESIPRALEIEIVGRGSSSQTVILSQLRWSGLQEVVVGDFSNLDVWCGGWANASTVTCDESATWNSTWKLAPVDGDFPASSVDVSSAMPSNDLRAMLTAIYGTVVGTLATYNALTPGHIQPSVHNPMSGYEQQANFFDPDSYLALTALLYSATPYLQQQVRKVLERTESFMLGTGEVPHHLQFIESSIVKPMFSAISGASQPGPTVFWVLACLAYVRVTGDIEWLQAHIDRIRRGVWQVLSKWDPDLGLVLAPGPLMIDVFRRANATADTNAAVVMLLHAVAEAETALHNETGARRLYTLRDDMADAMNTLLWSGDHFVTQLNQDRSTTDFVDYDANTIAIAAGVPPPSRASMILSRIDKGPCPNAHTFVSESWYGPKSCYGRNTGDSWTAMARIAYYHVIARQAMWQLAQDHIEDSSTPASSSSSAASIPLSDAALEGSGGEPANLIQQDQEQQDQEQQQQRHRKMAKLLTPPVQREAVADNPALRHLHSRHHSLSPLFQKIRDQHHVLGEGARHQTTANRIIDSLRDDVLRDTWIRERYGCDGLQQQNRTWGYFEYPSVVTMLLREVRYGIQLGMTSIVIRPTVTNSFSINLGDLSISWSKRAAVISVPGKLARRVEIHNMLPFTKFDINVYGPPECSTFINTNATTTLETKANGLLSFRAPTISNCIIRVSVSRTSPPKYPKLFRSLQHSNG